MVNFLKYRWLYFLISAVVIGSGLFSIVKWGFRYSIDFTGGSVFEFQTDKNINKKNLISILNKDKIEVVDIVVNSKIINLKTKALDQNQEAAMKNDLQTNLKVKLTVLSSETVGPILGKETINKTLIASILAIAGILIYMSFAFKSFNFALAAILAMFHDLLVVIGTYSLLTHFFGAEVDTMFVTAVLTTMSFSVHDTIIIFDKIREYHNEGESLEMGFASNKALNETLVRSLNNSMTIMFMLLALTLMGGTTIKFFILTLLIGTITGTYSSPFIATPILVWLEKLKQK